MISNYKNQVEERKEREREFIKVGFIRSKLFICLSYRLSQLYFSIFHQDLHSLFTQFYYLLNVIKAVRWKEGSIVDCLVLLKELS